MTRLRLRFAVIPTHNRPEQFASCVEALREQVDEIIVISHDALYTDPRTDKLIVRAYPARYHNPPNISQMWNRGLTAADLRSGGRPYDVAVLNDDCVVPPGWFDALSRAMGQHRAVAASADQSGTLAMPLIRHTPGPVDLRTRMSGFAFMLAGEPGVFADEQFQWWYGDDDLDWRCRQLGGTVIVPGFPVEHPPNGGGTTVGELARIAGEDRERFKKKWGQTPW